MTDPAIQALPDDLVEVGRIATAHGVQGWLKIQPYSQQAAALSSARTWWLAPVGAAGASPARAVLVQSCRLAAQHVLARVQGVDDRDAALALRGWTVWVPRASFPPPEADEYYWVDLIGCLFYGQQAAASALLGQVDDVFDNGAHAILQVARGSLLESGAFIPAADGRGRPQHVLIPFVAAHVRHVDLAARRIDGDWPVDF